MFMALPTGHEQTSFFANEQLPASDVIEIQIDQREIRPTVNS